MAAMSHWLGRAAPEVGPLAWQSSFWGEFISFAVAIVPAYLVAAVGIFLSRRGDAGIPAARLWWTVAFGMFAAATNASLVGGRGASAPWP